ncbi:MAG: thioredoxin [Oscillospiraceae bacterium]|nr:thioredoxin [Oscillospiraceae bacterium]
MAKCVDLTAETFEQFTAQPLVLVDFWMPGCAPCRMVEPILNELAAEYDGKIAIGGLDTSAHMEVAMKYGVMSVPTLVIFKSGQEAERSVGAKSKAVLAAWIDKYL